MSIEQPAVPSPCISICVLNDEDICEGCYRSGEEIADWLMANDTQKLTILERCEQRRSEA